MVERNKILCEECNVYIWYQNKAKHRETMKHKYNRYVNHDLFLIDGQQVNNIGDLVKYISQHKLIFHMSQISYLLKLRII